MQLVLRRSCRCRQPTIAICFTAAGCPSHALTQQRAPWTCGRWVCRPHGAACVQSASPAAATANWCARAGMPAPMLWQLGPLTPKVTMAMAWLAAVPLSWVHTRHCQWQRDPQAGFRSQSKVACLASASADGMRTGWNAMVIKCLPTHATSLHSPSASSSSNRFITCNRYFSARLFGACEFSCH